MGLRLSCARTMAIDMTILNAFWHALSLVMSPTQLLQDRAKCLNYSSDNGRHKSMPQGVVLPESIEQVQDIIRLCGQYHINVTARGRGTGTPGGAVATPNGIVLSLERMTKIIDFNPLNRSITVEAGVLNQSVQDLAVTAGLFWPPDPSSAAFCTVGGNVAYNAGGPRAVKYGATRDNVLALTAISGTGELLKTGFAMPKTACGYDLSRLLVGSEGTLAIIIDATLRLLPLQPATATLQVWFHSTKALAECIPALVACPAQACALEYMDGACLELLRQHSDLVIPPKAQALLMIEIDGLSSALPEAISLISAICRQYACIGIDSAFDKTARERLWRIRKALSPTLRQLAPHKINEDVVVPLHQLATLIEALARLAQDYQFLMVNFGHIGSGNLHVNVLLPHLSSSIQLQVDAYLSDLFHLVLQLGGALSGEHGIGLDKKPFMREALSPATLTMMRAIKNQFDPLAILNPDKLLP
jgi:D-lactate dehydrogenase